MSSAFLSADVAMKRSKLRLHLPPVDFASSARWMINGYPATILVWTAEEWSHLANPPDDAQACPNGTWCALRIE